MADDSDKRGFTNIANYFKPFIKAGKYQLGQWGVVGSSVPYTGSVKDKVDDYWHHVEQWYWLGESVLAGSGLCHIAVPPRLALDLVLTLTQMVYHAERFEGRMRKALLISPAAPLEVVDRLHFDVTGFSSDMMMNGSLRDQEWRVLCKGLLGLRDKEIIFWNRDLLFDLDELTNYLDRHADYGVLIIHDGSDELLSYDEQKIMAIRTRFKELHELALQREMSVLLISTALPDQFASLVPLTECMQLLEEDGECVMYRNPEGRYVVATPLPVTRWHLRPEKPSPARLWLGGIRERWRRMSRELKLAGMFVAMAGVVKLARYLDKVYADEQQITEVITYVTIPVLAAILVATYRLLQTEYPGGVDDELS